MLSDFKEQGSTQEQIEEMATPENYNKYKEISRPNTEKIVKLGMVFRSQSMYTLIWPTFGLFFD